jgi:hypothetical protein
VGGECLLHLGTTTDRHFPDRPDVPTVFLTRDCTVQVMRLLPLPPMPFLPLEDGTTARAEPKMDVPMKPTKEEEKLSLPRRVSSRVPKVQPVQSGPAVRRAVQERWSYETIAPSVPESQGSSDINNDSVLVGLAIAPAEEDTAYGPVTNPAIRDGPFIPLTVEQRRLLVNRFGKEGRL